MIYSDLQGLVMVCKGYVSADMMGCELIETDIIHPGSREKIVLAAAKLKNHAYNTAWLLDSESTICMSCGENQTN